MCGRDRGNFPSRIRRAGRLKSLSIVSWTLRNRAGKFHTLEIMEIQNRRYARGAMNELSLAPLPWPQAPASGLAFPYMVWAHTQPARTQAPLSNSGVPNAQADFLQTLRIDVNHPGLSALPAFEAAIAARLGVPKEAVIATPGASGGLAAAALALFPGNCVAVEVPGYEQLRSLALRFATKAVALPRRLEHGFAVRPEELDHVLRSAQRPDQHGHAFLTNTHNPSGARLTRPEMAALAQVCAQHDGVLISCDIYQEFLPAAERAWTCTVAPNTLTIGSLTKAYGLGPLRLGWIALGAGLMDRRHELRDATYLLWVDPPTTTLHAGVAALGHLDLLRAHADRTHAHSKPLLDHWLRTTPEIEAHVPAYGLVSFPRVRGWRAEGARSGHACVEWLVQHAGVDVVPGEFFGAPGHLRVSCGLPPEALAPALERLTLGLRTFCA